MKFFSVISLIILLSGCSTINQVSENKNISSETQTQFKDFKNLKSLEESFGKSIKVDKNFKFNLSKPVSNYEWKDIYYDETNNLKNLIYNDLNEIIFKSKRILKSNVSNFILFEENNLIANDFRGNIVVFSINKNKIITKFNFYKKI